MRKESNEVRIAVGLVQISSVYTASTMKHGALLTTPVHGELVHFRLELKKKLIYNGSTLVGL